MHLPARKLPEQHIGYRKLVPVILCWMVFIVINSFFSTAPYSKNDIPIPAVVLFFAPLFVALYFTFALILSNRRRGFLVSLLICGLLLIRLYGLTNPLTVFLLFAAAGFLEWYFAVQYPKTHHVSRLQPPQSS